MIKISRYAVEKFLNCKRCFFLEQKHKVRLQSLPFTLNNAVDNLCKNEFDHYRRLQNPHPLFIKNNIEAVPFKHENIDVWRSNFRGIRYKSNYHKYDFGGAIDDVWVKDNGDLIIADIKATSKNEFDWSETFNKYDYPKAYKRQLEMYQWLLKKNGFKVSQDAFIIYFNGRKNEKFFKNTLSFDSHVIKLKCSTDWVEQAIIDTVQLLKSKTFPKPSPTCEQCTYLRKRWNLSKNLKF